MRLCARAAGKIVVGAECAARPGLIGLGRIAASGISAEAFDMRVVALIIHQRAAARELSVNSCRSITLPNATLSLCTRVSPQTREMITLVHAKMKKGVRIVNAARGSSSRADLRRDQKRHVAGAASTSLLKSAEKCPLIGLPNVITTRMLRFTAEARRTGTQVAVQIRTIL